MADGIGKRSIQGSYQVDSNTGKSTGSPVILIVAIVVALLIGALMGFFIPRLVGLSDAGNPVSPTLSEQELDNEIGTYTYKGETYSISARDAIEATASLEDMKNEDGTYNTPSAEMLVAYARNEILNDEVEARGLTPSEEEVNEYMVSQLGTDDLTSFSEYMGISEEAAKKVIAEAAGFQKLHDEVTAEATVMPEPEAPVEAEAGKEDEATAEYGAYVVGLLGDNWNSEKETWANEDNPYYEAMKDASFTSKSASFNDASMAFSVAYMEYSEELQGVNKAWQEFANELYSQATLTTNTMYITQMM